MATPVSPPGFLVPPPVIQLPWGIVGPMGHVTLTSQSFEFLQLLWSAVQGFGGIIDQFTALVEASEDLTVGALVNIWDDAGSFRVRLADSTFPIGDLHWAHGFVRVGALIGDAAVVSVAGILTGLSGPLTPGSVFLDDAGGITNTAPVAGVSQQVGVALSATSIAFQPWPPVGL